MELAPLPELAPNAQAAKRFRLTLPPVLNLRFPHLADSACVCIERGR